ncbi:MAG: NAD(P)/FAD-dependent oxidoreductase [Thermoleophilia bacterium]|nr:NAD(P)/FAD-dependent oxidoreductase [Thermoleophilia bacterium]
MDITVAIVGNGGAAAEAVLALRASGFRESIHLFSDNAHPPYNPMLGPHVVSGKLPFACAFPFGDLKNFYDNNAVVAHLGEEVVCVDAEARTITTAAGSTCKYEKCLIATGAQCIVPPIGGLAELLDGQPQLAFLLRTPDDALSLKHAVDGLRKSMSEDRSGGDPPRVIVLGASLAGIKTAATLHDLGFDVCLIEQQPHILPFTAHPECAKVLEDHMTDEGYVLRLAATLAAVRRVSPRRLEIELGLPHATREQADLLVLCTGTTPRLGFLVGDSVEIDRGILVDSYLRSSVPSLYAAGDVAQGKELISGRHEVIGLWISARRQGRAAGRNLAGVRYRHPGEVRHTITPVGRMFLASMGYMDDYDDIRVSRTGQRMELYLFRQGRLTGVNILDHASMAGPLRQAICKAALRALGETEVTWPTLTL